MASLFLAPEIRRLAFASQGWRGMVALLALALGVALGYGVHRVHGVAVAETEGAARRLAGEADLSIQGTQGDGMEETLYPLLASRPEVAVASPVVEVMAKVPAKEQGQRERLRLLGLDLFRAGEIQPMVAALPDPLEILRPDRVFLNPAASVWLGARPGDSLVVQAGIGEVTLRVAGTVDLPGAPLAIMDIAAAQAAFGRVGRISRIDLRLRPGWAPERVAAELSSSLPSGVRAELPAVRIRQAADFARAYRVNLDMLALVALFTGGLLVFSSQTLAVLQRRRQLALLRTLGLSRREMLSLLLAEATFWGLMGGLLGVVLGEGLAVLLLKLTGADLGGAYFRGLAPRVQWDLGAGVAFMALGMAAAVLGSLLPAREAARASPARALHAGDEEELFAGSRSPWPGLLLLAAATVAANLPPVAQLPVFGYVAVAFYLLAAIALLPWATGLLLGLAAQFFHSRHGAIPLGLAQLHSARNQVALTLAPLVASIAVAAAMAVMVGSFRDSLGDWLDRLLPADLYLRAGIAGDSAFLPADAQVRLAKLPGIERIEFRQSIPLSLAPDKPPFTLLARRMDPGSPDRGLPLVGEWRPPDPGLPPAWISEAMADLHGWRLGQVVDLPLAGRPWRVQVAGIWRDYARSGGAVAVDRDAYVAASGDRRSNEAAVWLAPGADEGDVAHRLADGFPPGLVEVERPGELKRISLAIFDRTFAATYALEAAAVAVGLAGLSAGFAALVLARRREFGVLRHLGMGRRQVAAMLARQGAMLAGVALVVGFALGGILSWVLIDVVNRQSFHWSMDLRVPWAALAGFGLAVAFLATVTAAVSGRLAMQREAALAVREDW